MFINYTVIYSMAKVIRNVNPKDFTREEVVKQFCKYFDQHVPIWDKQRFINIAMSGETDEIK